MLHNPKPLKMIPLVKISAFAVPFFVGLLFFNEPAPIHNETFNLKTVPVLSILYQHQFECRSESDFRFYIEADLVKKIRGAHLVNVKIYIFDKSIAQKALLAEENIQINRFQGAIEIKDHAVNTNLKKQLLKNGDTIIGTIAQPPFSFNELIKYETVYQKYINATRKYRGNKQNFNILKK